jgi:uncharacterized protein YcnI
VIKRSMLAGLVVAIVVLGAAPAWAHIEIDPAEAPKGSDAVLAFTVPNEMDNANTTQVVVVFPTDHPIADASTEPVPGWTATVETATSSTPIKTDSGTVNERVSQITWKGGSIAPGQFQQFRVAVGLPDNADSLTFKALQTYSNGTVVRWIETSAPGGAEPEHPAPVLKLTSGSTTSANTAASSSSSTNDSDNNALAIVAIIVGGLALIAGAVALLRRPRVS